MSQSLKKTALVSIPYGLSGFWNENSLSEFREMNPSIKLCMTFYDPLEKIEFDSKLPNFIVSFHNTVPHAQNCTFLTSIDIKLFASPSYVALKGVPKNIEDMRNHSLLAYSYHGSTSFSAEDWGTTLGANEKTPLPIVFRSHSLQTLSVALEEGMGIAGLPSLQNRNLTPILPEVKKTLSVYLSYQNELAYAAEGFERCLKNEIQNLPSPLLEES
jgi:DNA-binding transcriptional LysR family regulator